MTEQLISFDTAKLAKKKGMQVGTQASYCEHLSDYIYDDSPDHPESHSKGDVYLDQRFYLENNAKGIDLSNEYYTLYEAPTQSLLQKWLFKKHGIFIELIWADTLSDLFKYHISTTNNTTRPDSNYIRDPFACLEKGLQEALKLIKH